MNAEERATFEAWLPMFIGMAIEDIRQRTAVLRDITDSVARATSAMSDFNKVMTEAERLLKQKRAGHHLNRETATGRSGGGRERICRSD